MNKKKTGNRQQGERQTIKFMEIFSISKNNFLTFVKSNLKVPDSSFIQPGISKRPDGAFRDLNIVENFHDHVKPSCSEHIQVIHC